MFVFVWGSFSFDFRYFGYLGGFCIMFVYNRDLIVGKVWNVKIIIVIVIICLFFL